ncbi:MAG TPA: hypothetical protein VF147_16425 [Vicinamibacterales bacterium]
MSDLVPSSPAGDSVEQLRARVTELEAELGERAAALQEAKAGLAAFRITYRAEVGSLHEELDDLELAIAEAEHGELARRLEEAGWRRRSDAPPPPRPDPAPRFTSDAVRTLFRDVAKAIHPDLARDEQARERRHALMVEANRAYASGDEERLRRILQAWERSPEAVEGDDPDAARARLARRVAEMEEDLAVCAGELAELQATSLWQLKVMVDEAAARGHDLIADTVKRLTRDIMVARNRLDAITWRP